MSNSSIIETGRQAWQRIRTRSTWADWLNVAEALRIGRTAAMKAAGSNRPFGRRYNLAIGQWLKEAGLDGINNQERYRALLCLENIDKIEVWRATLPEDRRRKLNHPGPVWSHWRASFKRGPRPRKPAPIARRALRDKPVFWPQDAIRRAADAMRESRSQDWLTLARLALESAVRTEGDLVALLDSAPKRPRLPAEAAAAAIA